MSAEHDTDVSVKYTLVRIIRTRLGLPEKLAVPLAEELAPELCLHFGGTYFPKRHVSHDDIRADFTGTNIDEVASKHGVSRATVYRATGKG